MTTDHNTSAFVVTVMRNASALIGKCVESVKSQTFTNWRMVIVDDASADDSANVAEAAAAGDPRITVVRNAARKYALRNAVNAIDRYASHNAIVFCLDGDDWLANDTALATVMAEYAADLELDALWTRHLREDGSVGPVCRDISANVRPVDTDWRSSHMKTFRKRVIWGVNRDIWLDENGKWWKSAYDVALYLPIVSLARKRKFLPVPLYVYNRTSSRDHVHAQQAANAAKIWEKVRRSEDKRNPKTVLFIVNGVNGGDSRFAWRPGCARPPLGVLTLMAKLRARGHSVVLCDRYLNKDWWPTRETLDAADVVAVYASSPNAADAKHILGRASAETNAKLIVGGPHCAIKPSELLPLADVVCKGEAENVIGDLVETDVTGFVDAGRVMDINASPFPDYEHVVNAGLKYRTDWPFSDASPVGVLNTSRGCPNDCAFCQTKDILGKQWVAQAPERTANDVAELVRLTGAKAIYFREDNFGANRKRLFAVCKALQGMPLQVEWATEIRADRASKRNAAKAMADAGCVGWYVGVESGSQRMLDLMRKKTTIAQLRRTAENARRNGINVAASLILEHPDETAEDTRATEALIAEMKPAAVWRNKYRPLPVPESRDAK